jgi:hypothetical protein
MAYQRVVCGVAEFGRLAECLTGERPFPQRLDDGALLGTTGKQLKQVVADDRSDAEAAFVLFGAGVVDR